MSGADEPGRQAGGWGDERGPWGDERGGRGDMQDGSAASGAGRRELSEVRR